MIFTSQSVFNSFSAMTQKGGSWCQLNMLLLLLLLPTTKLDAANLRSPHKQDEKLHFDFRNKGQEAKASTMDQGCFERGTSQ